MHVFVYPEKGYVRDFLPAALVVFGILCLFYRQETGLLFCKLSKAIWKVFTLGLTDMHWFYPEDKAPRIGLRLGLILCLVGTIFGSVSAISLSGPNASAAMSQANDYLKKTYGDSGNEYSLSCQAVPDKANDRIVSLQI